MPVRLGLLIMAILFMNNGVSSADGPATGPESAKGRGGETQPVRPGGAFNLRILSDSVPDFSTRENFAASALAHCQSEQDKAITQWRWSYRCRRVGSCVREDSRPVLDPVLFFNSYGVTYCSMISQINCSLWEGRGRPNRVVDLTGHVVSEIEYDGAWHMFDNDFCNYFFNEKGQVASAAELAGSRIHGNIADLKPGEFYIFDHCPAASCVNGRIFMGPSSASLIEVARDWYPGPGEKIRARPRLGYTGSQAGQRYILGLRPGERYIRFWKPQGTGEKYARLFPSGKDPMEEGGQVLRNCRGNGHWENGPYVFASENVTDEKGWLTVKGKVGDPGTGMVIFRVQAANVITGGQVPFSADQSACSVSVNGGLSWIKVPARPVLPPRTQPEPEHGPLPKEVAGRLEYLVKYEGPSGARLVSGPGFYTETQVNPRTLPALRLGTNNILAISDGQYETMTFNPRLSGDQADKEVFKLTGFQGIKNPTDTQPSLHSTGGDAALTLRAQTPRPIKSLRMAATVFQPEGGAEFFMHTSFDGGKTWNELRHDLFAGWPADHRYEVRLPQDKVPARSHEVLMKYSFDSAGCGLVNVFAEVNYEAAGPFMPYVVTYEWDEYQGNWVGRSHRERIDTPYHKYTINVGGTRPPRMSDVSIAGPAPEVEAIKAREPWDGPYYGYLSWGHTLAPDPGDNSARPGYRLVRGNNVARGCKYETNRPASAAFPDVGGKLLTDGMLMVSSYWGLQDINLTGKKNDRRVGDLAVWEAAAPSPQPSPQGEGDARSAKGEDLVVTIDLGKSQKVGGVRICALQPNEKVLYPREMIVETSADGKTFAEAGRTNWEECFFPPADELPWEGADSPLYEKLPAGGILDFKFPVMFAKEADARYIRFRLASPADPKAAIALWELEVYDTLKREPFEDRITLPDRPK